MGTKVERGKKWRIQDEGLNKYHKEMGESREEDEARVRAVEEEYSGGPAED